MQNSISQYFSKGFTLTNKSWDILLISLIFESLIYLPEIIPHLDGFIYFLISLLLFISFSFSLPVFIMKKQQQKFNYRQVFELVLDNMKRLVLPFIILGVILGIIFIITIIIVTASFNPSESQMQEFFRSLAKPGWHPSSIILGIFFAFLIFSPFLFSLEKKGFFRSIIKSIRLSFKHPNFVSIVALINAVWYPLAGFLPQDFWSQTVNILSSGYITLILSATTLYYYQVNIKEKV